MSKSLDGALVTIALAAATCPAREDGELTPPFTPKVPSTQASRFDTVVYVNGQNTEAVSAECDASLLADQVGTSVRLCYNDLTLPVVDWISTAVEKTGSASESVNAATGTLVKLIREDV